MGWRVKKNITAQDLSKAKDITPGMTGANLDTREKVINRCKELKKEYIFANSRKRKEELEKNWNALGCHTLVEEGSGQKISAENVFFPGDHEKLSDTHKLENYITQLQHLLNLSRKNLRLKSKQERMADDTYKEKLKAMRRVIKNAVRGHYAIHRKQKRRTERCARLLRFDNIEYIDKIYEQFHTDDQGTIWTMWLEDIEDLKKKKF